MLIENLPPGCAHYRALHGPWTDLEHLLANLSDQVGHLTYVSHIGHGLKPKPRKPKPTPRPGEKDKHQVGHRNDDVSPEDVVAYLDQFKPGGSARPVAAQEETPSTRAALAKLRGRAT